MTSELLTALQTQVYNAQTFRQQTRQLCPKIFAQRRVERDKWNVNHSDRGVLCVVVLE